MPVFKYKALAAGGETQEGRMEAPSVEVVIARLQESGCLPIDAQPMDAMKASRGLWFRSGIRSNDILLLTRKLSVMLKAGLTLDAALALLIDMAEPGELKQTLEQVVAAVQNGMALSDALEQHATGFDRFYINTLRAGEAAGALDVVMTRLADYLERSHALNQSIRSALIYPAVLISVAIVTLVILLVYVVPQFQTLFDDMGQALPLATQIVIAVADVLASYGWLLLLVAPVLVISLNRLWHNEQARRMIDRGLLRLPLIKEMVMRLEVARFSRTLATLLANGVPMLMALGVVSESINNGILRQAMMKLREGVRDGGGMGRQLEQLQIFPAMAVQLIRVGEETGQLEAMLEQVADIYDQELREAVQRFLGLLEPALIIGLGVIIAGIISSVLLAILSLNDFAV